MSTTSLISLCSTRASSVIDSPQGIRAKGGVTSCFSPKSLGCQSSQTNKSTASDKLKAKVARLVAGLANEHLRKEAVCEKVDRKFVKEESSACDVFDKIDTDGDASICMYDFLLALQRERTVAEFLLPGVDVARALLEGDTFDVVSDAFTTVARGQKVVQRSDFVAFFEPPTCDVRAVFDRINKDGTGLISFLDLLAAFRSDASIKARVCPGEPEDGERDDFDLALDAFDAMASGRRRATLVDFRAFLESTNRSSSPQVVRKEHIVLAIGFGLYQRHADLLLHSGYPIVWADEMPNQVPGSSAFQDSLGKLHGMVTKNKPTVMVCAGAGCQYGAALIECGAWRGPTVLVEPGRVFSRLAEGVRIVMANESTDTSHSRRNREELESLLLTASPNTCLLYHSGRGRRGSKGDLFRRAVGGSSTMESLLLHDCLPRLVDAAVYEGSPEVYMMRSWRHFSSERRVIAEQRLGYCLDKVHRRWESKGRCNRSVSLVAQDSEEFLSVVDVFHATLREASVESGPKQEVWQDVSITKIERVENSVLENRARVYSDSMTQCLYDQGITKVPGVHTRWGFYATDDVQSIVDDGFQSLSSGALRDTCWGPGTYFARDAKAAADSDSSRLPRLGYRQMLLCLLSTGMSCLGHPQDRGLLPIRQGSHRYDSTVDSLSCPTNFIVQQPGAAYPAYIITYS